MEAEESLGGLLGDPAMAQRLVSSRRVSRLVLVALAELAEQAVHRGIDYGTLGLGYSHPKTRQQYRLASHPSATCGASRLRAEDSRRRLAQAVGLMASGAADPERMVVDAFLHEIGLHSSAPAAAKATFAGVAAALRAELLLPLRALNEGQVSMCRTHNGEPLPPELLAQSLQEMLAAVLSRPGGLAAWRYTNPVGAEQLRGLTEQQLEAWREPSSVSHVGGLRTHEGDAEELALFWATKIGGPSHGFDHEGQCLLPLLANARHKVVLVDDPAWPEDSAGRAHFRLLWATSQAGGCEPRLFLEALHCDFDVAASGAVDQRPWVTAVLRHAAAKADAMQVPLSVALELEDALAGVVGEVARVQEQLELRPSNGVCEASDALSRKHDWVQLETEVTEPLPRALYKPGARGWLAAPERWLFDKLGASKEVLGL